jgi:hypothetical protein
VADSQDQIESNQPDPPNHPWQPSPLGPVWERERPLLKSAALTIWQVLRHPTRTFSPLGPPDRKSATTFGVLLGTFELTLYLMDAAPFHDQTAINSLIVASCLIGIPFIAWGLLYLDAGIVQLFLDLTKSGASKFNNTFRVIAYTGGSLSILTAIPLLGEVIAYGLGAVLIPYALALAHGVAKSRTYLAFLVMYLFIAILIMVIIMSL